MTTAAVIYLPETPITGNKFQTEKTTYKAAKHAVNAMFRVDINPKFIFKP
jgi:hypothetical protein